MTPQQVEQFAVFVEQLARDIREKHMSPDQVRLKIAHKLAMLGVVDRPEHVARRPGCSLGLARLTGSGVRS